MNRSGWSRSFTIIRRVAGKTLDERWPSLTPSQRSGIAETMAKYCLELSNITSYKFESATKRGVVDQFLNDGTPIAHPTWQPRLIGPMSHGHFTKLLNVRTSESPYRIPSFGKTFHFYHSDLGPTNIMISEAGKVSGIIDWEAASFYPRFWIALKPKISAGFYLEPAFEGQIRAERWAWGELLQTALIAEGFEYSDDHFPWYKSLKN